MPNPIESLTLAVAPEPYTVMMEITPEMATAWLLKNKSNRALNLINVNRYAADMRAGSFGATTDAIGIDAQGWVFNGQHRLHACVRAGVAFRQQVVFNGTPHPNQDRGGKRSLANVLQMQGYTHGADLIAMAAKWYLVLTAGVSFADDRTGKSKLSEVDIRPNGTDVFADNVQVYPAILKRVRDEDVIDTIEAHSGLLRLAEQHKGELAKVCKPPGLFVALAYVLGRIDQLATDTLFSTIAAQGNGPHNARLVYNYLNTLRGKGFSRTSAHAIVSKVITGWKAIRTGGEDRSFLRASSTIGRLR